MSENLSNLETAVSTRLAKELRPTPELIREVIRKYCLIDDFYVDAVAAEQLAKTLETRLSVTMTVGSILTDRMYEPWLDNARSTIDPFYWNRYKRLLSDKHLSSQVIVTLDDVTNRTLGLLENPRVQGPWDRRGMVVGHVQSGKTANYIGLVAKAADAGYKVIIVIAGIHNNLRNQTQLRIDEGFVGRDSARLLSNKVDKFVGVGHYDSTRRPVTFTNSVKDFNKGLATGIGIPLQNLNEPAVFVIKKNSTTLKNLLEWLREHSAQGGGETVNSPMLLIDDEADNASINVRHGAGEVSRINGQIRGLLKLFERSCYVGYTATPFANIFIDPDTVDDMLGHDLFPRNFIISLDPPSNYFGAEKVFLNDDQAVIRHITDSESWLPTRHKITTAVTVLSPSLLDAINTFIVSCAIRLVRGHVSSHCSMLVNVSRFTNVQKQVRNEIHRKLDEIQASVRILGKASEASTLKSPEIQALKEIWIREYSTSGAKWPEVLAQLHEAVAPIKVIEVNSGSSGALNYADNEKSGLSVIVVGGLALSRGLTLEGLMVSYFLRNSIMYDTLMQMGRWFGYRPDYEDLCRVWMPEESEGWYAHIAKSIEELREELRVMEASGASPEEFGLKVRSHPDTLIVTARNKLGSSEEIVVEIGLGNSFIETATLRFDEASTNANRLAAIRLAKNVRVSASASQQENRGLLFKNVPAKEILDFIADFQNHALSMLTETGPVVRYIEERSETELSKWDVFFASLAKQDKRSLVDDSLGFPIICQRRRRADRDKDSLTTLRITNKQRVSSRGVEKTGLKEEERNSAEQNYREDPQNIHKIDSGGTVNYPDYIYRRVRKRPLLIIHLLAIGEDDKDLSGQKPVVAWSISFPETATPERKVEYRVGSVWLKENYREELDDEEMGGDDV